MLSSKLTIGLYSITISVKQGGQQVYSSIIFYNCNFYTFEYMKSNMSNSLSIASGYI